MVSASFYYDAPSLQNPQKLLVPMKSRENFHSEIGPRFERSVLRAHKYLPIQIQFDLQLHMLAYDAPNIFSIQGNS